MASLVTGQYHHHLSVLLLPSPIIQVITFCLVSSLLRENWLFHLRSGKNKTRQYSQSHTHHIQHASCLSSPRYNSKDRASPLCQHLPKYSDILFSMTWRHGVTLMACSCKLSYPACDLWHDDLKTQLVVSLRNVKWTKHVCWHYLGIK